MKEISICVKKQGIVIYHTNLKVEEKVLEEIQNNKIIPDKYWNSVCEFLKSNERTEKNITEIIVFYWNNSKEEKIYCNNMKGEN